MPRARAAPAVPPAFLAGGGKGPACRALPAQGPLWPPRSPPQGAAGLQGPGPLPGDQACRGRWEETAFFGDIFQDLKTLFKN